MGAPANRDMREFFQNLAGFWLDHVGVLPGVTYSDIDEVYGGRFVAFAQKFCRELAAGMAMQGYDFSMIAKLEDVSRNPVRVRTWLKSARVPRLKSRLRSLL
jgi:hypothetical protein